MEKGEKERLLQVVFRPPHVQHGMFTHKIDLKQENSFERMIKLTSYTHIHKTELPPRLVLQTRLTLALGTIRQFST